MKKNLLIILGPLSILTFLSFFFQDLGKMKELNTQKKHDIDQPKVAQKTRLLESSVKKSSIHNKKQCDELSANDLIKSMDSFFEDQRKIKTLEEITHFEKNDGHTHVIKFSYDPQGKKKLAHFKLSDDGFPIAQELSLLQSYQPSKKLLAKLYSGKKTLSLVKKSFQYGSSSFYVEIEDEKIKYLSLTSKDKFKTCKNLKNSPLFLSCACR